MKNDGLRALLYVDNTGECYLINRNNDNNVRKMGMNLGNEFASSLYDGEHFQYDINRKIPKQIYCL